MDLPEDEYEPGYDSLFPSSTPWHDLITILGDFDSPAFWFLGHLPYEEDFDSPGSAGGTTVTINVNLASQDSLQELLEVEKDIRDACAVCGIERITFRLPNEDSITWDIETGASTEEQLREQVKAIPASQPGPAPSVDDPVQVIDGFRLSPIEASFYGALKGTELVFTPQCPFVYEGRIRYRIDFLVHFGGRSVAVELDGHEFHKTREQRTRDAARDRFLRMRGIDTIRFTGSEIHSNLQGCMNELLNCLTRKPSIEW